MRKVFISHANLDKELADLTQGLIETGIGIPHHEVFCTSLDGLGIPEGTPDFKEYIRKEMDGCDTVVALISLNYYASPFCMCELGAVWVLAKNFFPILVPPVDFKDLRGALAGMQCRKLEDPLTASALYTRLSKLVAKPVPIERWDVKKEVFYKALPDVLARLPKPDTVKREELERMKEERERFKSVSVQLEEECNVLKLQIKELEVAKDAKAVTVIRKKYSSEWEQFEALSKSCRLSLKELPRIIREALYYWVRGEAFAPDVNQWGDEIEHAVENKLLTAAKYEDNHFWPNEERPKIAQAIERISALKQFLEKEASPEFYDEAKDELGDTPDLTRRSYWEHL